MLYVKKNSTNLAPKQVLPCFISKHTYKPYIIYIHIIYVNVYMYLRLSAYYKNIKCLLCMHCVWQHCLQYTPVLATLCVIDRAICWILYNFCKTRNENQTTCIFMYVDTIYTCMHILCMYVCIYVSAKNCPSCGWLNYPAMWNTCATVQHKTKTTAPPKIK